MAAQGINVAVISGNLTRDPELRSTPGGTAVCDLRVAVNGRRKNQAGAWVDKPNYLDVVTFGKSAENCGQYLAKGRPIAVEGRLDWQEWEAKDGSGKRQAVKIIANSVQFLGYPKTEGASSNGNAPEVSEEVTKPEAVAVGAGGEEDEIPF